MGPIGWQEVGFIFLLALVMFGPRKLPEMGRTVGRVLAEYRRASNELKATLTREFNDLDREHQSIRELAVNRFDQGGTKQ